MAAGGKVLKRRGNVAADSDFVDASFGLENAYAHAGNFDASKKLLIKNYINRERMTTYNRIYASYAYALSFEAPEECIRYLRQLEALDDQWPRPAYLLGVIFNWADQYHNAIPEFEKAFEIYRKWGKEYMKNSYVWERLGLALDKTPRLTTSRWSV